MSSEVRPTWIARLVREPLVGFLLAGLVLFGAYRALNPAPVERGPSNQIRLTEDDMRQMTAAWRAQGRPPPGPREIASLIEARVREEVLFREALALGLDRDDTIVRRRLAQKMEFLAEDVSAIGEPKPGEIEAWFADNGARFALSPRLTFRHVYFSPDRRGGRAQADAAQALLALGGKRADISGTTGMGDRFMFDDHFSDVSIEQVAAQFGPPFAQAVLDLKPGAWQGPVQSGYGWHVVFVESLTPGRVPAFEEIAPDVKREWLADRREKGKRKIYEAMRARYEVVLPPALTQGPSEPGLRTAPKQ